MEEKLNFSSDQLKAIELVEQGKNVFLTGGAGVGKSAVVKEIIRRYREKGKNVVVLAPTGRAALNVRGETIHHFFGLKTSPLVADLYAEANKINYQVKNKLEETDLVIIDEISMVRRDVFDVITTMMFNARYDIQLMVVGDFQQLPPVIIDKGPHSDKALLMQHYEAIGEEWHEGGYAFQAAGWLDWDFQSILLTKVFRQEDERFIAALSLIARGDPEGKACKWIKMKSRPEEIPDCTWICSTNREVDQLNAVNIEKLDGKTYRIEAEIDGGSSFQRDQDCPVPKVLELKVGALVMPRVNDKNGVYVNGSVGKITKIDLDRGKISVSFDDGYPVEISKYEWEDLEYRVVEKKLETNSKGSFRQFPLVLAYAITVHKSQGATLEKANVKPMCFENGQLYTMLSRVKSIDGMYIDGNLARKYCKSNDDVVELYNKMRAANKPVAPEMKQFSVKVPALKEVYVKSVIKSYLKDENFARQVNQILGIS